MEGYILVYSGSKQVQTNNALFGKITTIKRGGYSNKYFYKGLLDNIKYIKLSKGCYFLTEKVDESTEYKQIPCTLDIDIDKLNTAREYWKKFIDNNEINVRNFWV